MNSKKWLFGKTLSELQEIVKEYGEPKFRAKQIAQWLYEKNCSSLEDMSTLSKGFREKLSQEYIVGTELYEDKVVSRDGTTKYIFITAKEQQIESVMIPDGDRATLCVSSQAGCKMNCKFCMTGRGGYKHQLTTGEILNQIREVNRETPLTNLVYMGMGEPLDNVDCVMKSFEILTSSWGYGMSPTRITLSTIGIIPALRRFIEECSVHLAVSLHNPFASERLELMPVEKAYRIEDVVALIKHYDFSHQRRVSFEYIMFKGVNDGERHLKGLVALLKGLKCRINLIRFHKIPDSPLASSPYDRIVEFRDKL
ncbi:MAG: 23S rRNA (adenine(2503)-C(2))-methyltransferase RlmN, partial [Rikenellaceae bacterium]